jgi:hypothetical protein
MICVDETVQPRMQIQKKKQVIERKSLYGLRESILDTKYLRSIIFYMPITTPFNNK